MINRLKNLIVCTLLVLLIAPACEKGANEPSTPSSLEVGQTAESSSSVTVVWRDNDECNNYKIAIYNRHDDRYPYQEYDLVLNENTPRAFSFPLLKAQTTYNVKVTNDKGISSELTAVSTAPAEKMVEGDIFLQNFNNLCWGYDFMNEACGVKLTSVTSTYAPNTLEDTMAKWEITTSVVSEDDLFKFTKVSMHELLGIKDWSGTGKVYHRPGHARLGTSSAIGTLRTPAATLLPVSGREVMVEFKACPYTLGEVKDTHTVTVRLIDSNGKTIEENLVEIPDAETMPAWSVTSTTFEMMQNGQFVEFESSEGQPICIDDIHVYYPVQIEGENVYGYITDNYNRPVKDVVVSDGFSVTTTDAEGWYELTPISDTYYIFISIPSEYEIPINEHGSPCFFKRYEKGTRQYNFQLTCLKNGAEKEFALFGFGDPQVSSTTSYNRFMKEAVPGIKKHADTFTLPVYGITAGDIVSVTDSSRATPYMPKMRDGFAVDMVGMPVFQVMGNHDNVFFNSNNIIEADETSSTFNLKAQRDFEKYFGPANYSFNRGDAHIIGMRNIIYNQNTSSSKYSKGFTKAQYDWLKADLSHVPKDKMVILVVHIPLWNATYNYINQVYQLIDEYNEAHIISGHMHYRRNFEYTSYDIYEHNIGAVCGAWWASCICGDGAPNGYEVFLINGNKMTKWYHMGYSEGMDDPNNQLRLYRGNGLMGQAISGDNPNGTMGYYAFNFDDDVILANVFDADSKWVISVYEDGVKTGEMEYLNRSAWITGLKVDELVGTFTEEDPRRAPDGVITTHDFWAHGFHMGVLGRKTTQNASWSPCYTMFRYTLKDKSAKKVEVVAKDRFGNEYRCSRFSDAKDYKYAAKPILY